MGTTNKRFDSPSVELSVETSLAFALRLMLKMRLWVPGEAGGDLEFTLRLRPSLSTVFSMVEDRRLTREVLRVGDGSLSLETS